jgi:hypothetical protein
MHHLVVAGLDCLAARHVEGEVAGHAHPAFLRPRDRRVHDLGSVEVELDLAEPHACIAIHQCAGVGGRCDGALDDVGLRRVVDEARDFDAGTHGLARLDRLP